MCANSDFTLVAHPVAEYLVDETALRLLMQTGPVTFDHPVHRERDRCPFEHFGRSPGVGGGARDDQPPPFLAAGSHRRHQPAVLAVRPGRTPRTPLPVVKQFGGGVGAWCDCECLMGKVLQHHRLAEHARCGLDDAGGRDAPHAEVGEGLVHAAVERHLLELLGHDPAMHLLGHFDELDLVVEFHQRQVQILGKSGGRSGERPGRAQFDDDPERARIGEPAQISGG